jgi:hypothetical protein
MIANTTKLNTPGPELAELSGVHALTDVTGFGLRAILEIARGAKLTAHINWADVPLLPKVSALIKDGNVTGASGRNWEGYGQKLALATVCQLNAKRFCQILKPVAACWSVVRLKQCLRCWLFLSVTVSMMQPVVGHIGHEANQKVGCNHATIGPL